MSDLIEGCATAANDHGWFVSYVARLTRDWSGDWLITGWETGQIQRCAAQANIP
jgi:hypothetical protein